MKEETTEGEEKTLLVWEEQREGASERREGRDGALEGPEKALPLREKTLEGQASTLEGQSMMLCRYSQLQSARETITVVREARISLRKEFTVGARWRCGRAPAARVSVASHAVLARPEPAQRLIELAR
jgi:hypothetical protein